MNRFISLLFLCVCILPLKAQEVAHAITDKNCYLTGERLHVRIDITDAQQKPMSLSKVAYIELSDNIRICAQGMAMLNNGSGWADIALPATMHSGNYQLSVYTRSMRNQAPETFFRKVISVVNTLRVVRADNVVYLPADSIQQTFIAYPTTEQKAGETINIKVDEEWRGGTLSLTRKDLVTPIYDELPQLKPQASKAHQEPFIPEVEGHIVTGRPTGIQPIVLTRLVMVGRMAAIYDGQWQSDGSWLYYTSGLTGNLPTILNSYDNDGQPVGMEFVSPFAKVLPQALPKLKVYCNEEDLQRRSLSAQREQAISSWQKDSLLLSKEYLSSEPHHSYDLDEYTKFSTVREILIEFIKGVQRSKREGANQLFTIDPETHQYSRWPALVLLDGMPVHDVDDILNYDARLLKYVQIYTDRYTFGNTMCQGIISFISQKGRLSNYKVDAGSHLVSYQFPQDHPDFLYPASNDAGTIYWNPAVTDENLTLTLPSSAGEYELLYQTYDTDGSVKQKKEIIVIK